MPNSENKHKQTSAVHSGRQGQRWLKKTRHDPELHQYQRQSNYTEHQVTVPDLTPPQKVAEQGKLDPILAKEILAKLSMKSKAMDEHFATLADPPPSSDLEEKVSDWKPQESESPAPLKESERTSTTPKSDAESGLVRFVDRLLDNNKHLQSVVLLFATSEKSLQGDEVATKVSSELAQRNQGRVLLIDSDLDTNQLTRASGLLGESGISDIVNKGASWDSLVYGGAEINLEFIPSGSVPLNQRQGRLNLRRAINAMKTRFKFICVTVGDAHGRSTPVWSDICDSSYLVVSLQHTHKTYASSAINRLREIGARLDGCVLTDID